MKDKIYIPGFDWVKLLGSIVIALYHICLSPILAGYIDAQQLALFSNLVPVFFLIAGYLMYVTIQTKPEPIRNMRSYIFKYGCIYYVLCLIGNTVGYFQIYLDTGVFALKSFIFEMFTLPCYPPPMRQLWFVPPLIIGIVINTFVFLKEKERRFLWLLIPFALSVIICSIYGGNFLHLAPVRAVTSWKYYDMMSYFVSRSAQGILFVYIGMWIAKNREFCAGLRLYRGILPAFCIMAVEAALLYRYGSNIVQDLRMNFTVCVWAVIIFLSILRLKGSFLQKYHSFITVFSGLMFFLHIWQYDMLSIWIKDSLLCFLLILITNLLLSLLITQFSYPKVRK